MAGEEGGGADDFFLGGVFLKCFEGKRRDGYNSFYMILPLERSYFTRPSP